MRWWPVGGATDPARCSSTRRGGEREPRRALTIDPVGDAHRLETPGMATGRVAVVGVGALPGGLVRDVVARCAS